MIEYWDLIQNKWSLTGLVIDIIGFSLLTWDLINLQSLLKSSAQKKIDNINEVNGMALSLDHISQYCEQLGKVIKNQAENEFSTANRSIKLSITGALLVITGFIFQIIGLFP